MKKIYLLILMFFTFAITNVLAQTIPAFPGAEGFGAQTAGGRGGVVIHVTNLNDSGPGSFRNAVNAVNAPRTIVFDVGGVIDGAFASTITIIYPYCTIAGQTAPGSGICLKGSDLSVGTHDVIIRNFRVRAGDDHVTTGNDYDGADGIKISNETNQGPVYNVIFDHCSVSWATDENGSVWENTGKPHIHDVTFQWNIISEGLKCAGIHREGGVTQCHSMGLLVGDRVSNVSMHHNLLAHNSARNALIESGTTTQFINNVIYNWYDAATSLSNPNGANLTSFTDVINNYYKPGLDYKHITNPNPSLNSFWEVVVSTGNTAASRFYLSGNKGPNRPSGGDDWLLVKPGATAFRSNTQVVANPTLPITILDVDTTYNRVVKYAGASVPTRDATDTRVAAGVLAGTGRIPDHMSDIGGYPAYSSGTVVIDTDSDGMPDSWEDSSGLNKNSATDGPVAGPLSVTYTGINGYTNLEVYINSLMGTITVPPPSGNATVTWPCTTGSRVNGSLATSPSMAVSTGNVTGGNQVMSSTFAVKDYTGGASPNGPYQRSCPFSGSTQTNWGGESDIVEGRYTEFSVSPSSGNAFLFTNLSMKIGGLSTSQISAKIYYSTDNFATRTLLGSTGLLPQVSSTVAPLSASYNASVGVGNGKTLKIRVYPYSALVPSSNTKYLVLSDVTIIGNTVSSATASASWPCTTSSRVNTSVTDSPSQATVTGNVTGGNQVMSSTFNIKDYTGGTSPNGPYQRSCPFSGTTQSYWGGEADIVEGRYTEFSLSPTTGNSLTLTNVSMKIGGQSTSQISAKIYWSTDNFATRTLLGSTGLLPQVSSTVAPLNASYTANVGVASGQTIKVRVYPYNALTPTSNTKYLVLSNVVLSGVTVSGSQPIATTRTIGENLLGISTAMAVSDHLQVYPNPGTATVVIRHPQTKVEGEIIFYSLVGVKQLSVKVLPNSSSSSADVSGLAAGMYVVRYAAGNTKAAVKFIKN